MIGVTAPAIVALDGGVCAVDGVRAAGVAAGLKPSGRPDLALVDAGAPVPAAAVQTRNQVQAAPVRVTARHLADGRARAVLLNAGNANACTGPEGIAVAEESASAAAAGLACDASDVLLCSTGVIGVSVPREALLAGVPAVIATLSRDGDEAAARAIMTTDTTPKRAAVRVRDAVGAQCTVGGMAKGSGMIAPEMATMLCVLTTDAPLAEPTLGEVLRQAVDTTFNRISVDGCMSTNDAVVLLATGRAPNPAATAAVAEGVTAVCGALAEAIVRDGEGTQRVVHLQVTGAASEGEALGVARAVAGSVLFRTAVAGGDPNWGRVLAAVGAGPVRVVPDRIAVAFGDVTVCRGGVVAPFDAVAARAATTGQDVHVRIDLGLGAARAGMLTCDLTHDYVTINAEYTT